ncbi:hypothetical protein [Zobellia galactanivorans]|uniref:hypothetical protein n=1 Tax=Zobellia galactanivorans (strain DSM 12802 / CCUG 47099 / CIP 106680 / NCIMB 13871 / Dsij) TaxID=63186 RepID=UPI001C06F939|nr:hypothetical protein [Zobellia galactanivorans]MBU3026969.1 hypothetical protein [Zobellia galactanivorans]
MANKNKKAVSELIWKQLFAFGIIFDSNNLNQINKIMRKIKLLFSIVVFTSLGISCEGPEGPPGQKGSNGIDGAAFEAAAFEIDIDLSLSPGFNRYEFLFEPYPLDISLLSGDAILVYRLEEVNNGLDVWRQLPQPVSTNEGLLFYNFDFTQTDFSLFVEPEFDASLVESDFTQGQIFRIIIVPTDFNATAKIDKSSISAVMSSMGLTEADVLKASFK